MALSAQLETLLTELEKIDPVGAKEQRTILEKHAGLQKPVQEAMLRQSDYDRFMNDNKAKLKHADEVADWFKKNKPVHEQLQRDYAELAEQKSRLEAEVQTKAAELAARAAAGGGDGGNPEAVAKAVMDKLGGSLATKAEVARLVAEETEKQAGAARDRFYKEDVPAALAYNTAMMEASWRYRDEFGKSINRAEFAKFMVDNKIGDPIEAYERYTEKDRRDKEIEAEVTRRTDEAKKKIQAEYVPGSSGSQGLGHLQLRVSKKEANDPLFSQDIQLGDNAAAMAAAAELRNEGRG